MDGLNNIGLIEAIDRHFNIHPLTQEDILNTVQRPKYEDFGNYIYTVLKMLYVNEEEIQVE